MDGTLSPAALGADSTSDLETLERIQRRVLWLATSMVHHANHVRMTGSGVKVGGHQASSASMVSIMTALFYGHLECQDRVSVKPHASPVLHAINYLLGRLDRRYLTELRAFGGIQSYPSRTKDPDPVDFSTGSVGIGATATIWSSLTRRYLETHFDPPPGGRHIALLGDAELDEGAVWEALADPMVSRLDDVLWVVDVNRQSLDRVVPELAVDRLRRMFEAAGWQTIVLKYGRELTRLFDGPGGDALRDRIDTMSNAEYQRLLRSDATDIRSRLVGGSMDEASVQRALEGLDDIGIYRSVRDLGGHDLSCLLGAFGEAGAVRDRPTVVFAYTIKGWGLPIEGHPGNHSALLTPGQWHDLAATLGTDPLDPWQTFEEGSAEDGMCRATAVRLERIQAPLRSLPPLPSDIGGAHAGRTSTQQSFGRFFLDLMRTAPEVARLVVTVSPDVASSTNLGGWINKARIWNLSDRDDWFADDTNILVRWQESGRGQHIELGIAEGNLVGLLSELGSTWSRDGQPLLPIGSVYDPFVARALEQWSFGIYSGGQSILVGTPSGVTLAPEGGAHQSIITPSIGLEQPQVVAWEPAFGQDLEWALLHALGQLGRPGGTSAYFRLSTRPVDQSLSPSPVDPSDRAEHRRRVLSGGYHLRRAPGAPQVTLVGAGAVLPEVLEAAEILSAGGVTVDVICLTSADLVFRAVQARRGLGVGEEWILDDLFPSERATPMVTVLDGHPHTLSFLAGIHGVAVTSLGVTDFGQVGDVDQLYQHFGMDSSTIAGAAFDLIDQRQGGAAHPI